MPKNTQQKGIEEKVDSLRIALEEITGDIYADSVEINKAITKTLTTYGEKVREEIVKKIEGMENCYEEGESLHSELEEHMENIYETLGEAESAGYNQALNDILQSLNSKDE